MSKERITVSVDSVLRAGCEDDHGQRFTRKALGDAATKAKDISVLDASGADVGRVVEIWVDAKGYLQGRVEIDLAVCRRGRHHTFDVSMRVAKATRDSQGRITCHDAQLVAVHERAKENRT